ncbi:hypothetical protein DMENIID0001_040690 [Sergentomyia squamirostris]
MSGSSWSYIGTTPTAAMKVMLDIPPLPLFIKAGAASAAIRLRANKTWRSDGRKESHEKILGEITRRQLDLLVNEDFFVHLGIPKKTFKVITPSRADWGERAEEIIESGAVNLSTDGSHVNGTSGADYYCEEPQLRESVALCTNTSVFQAEIAAISAMYRFFLIAELQFLPYRV